MVMVMVCGHLVHSFGCSLAGAVLLFCLFGRDD
jgi:hypothetical protein